jgi:hypothetical protein
LAVSAVDVAEPHNELKPLGEGGREVCVPEDRHRLLLHLQALLHNGCLVVSNASAKMPIMRGERDFAVFGLFATDYAVAGSPTAASLMCLPLPPVIT